MKFILIDYTVYPKKYAHGFCFAVLYCGYTLTDFPISTRLTSLALWQSNDCPSASKATLMNMDKYFMWIDYERLHNHNKAKHNKTVCIFLGINCMHTKFIYYPIPVSLASFIKKTLWLIAPPAPHVAQVRWFMMDRRHGNQPGYYQANGRDKHGRGVRSSIFQQPA